MDHRGSKRPNHHRQQGNSRYHGWRARQPRRTAGTHLLGRSDDNTSIGYVAFFTSLEIDGSRQFFVAVERATRDTGNFLVVDDGLAVLNHGDPSTEESDIETLPFYRFAGLLRRRGKETVYAAHVVARRLLDGVCFYLNFVPASQINAAVGGGAAVELHMQLEVFKFGIIDQFRPVSRTYQVTVFDFPHRRTWSGHLPSCQIFAIEQRNRLAPLRGTSSLQ